MVWNGRTTCPLAQTVLGRLRRPAELARDMWSRPFSPRPSILERQSISAPLGREQILSSAPLTGVVLSSNTDSSYVTITFAAVRPSPRTTCPLGRIRLTRRARRDSGGARRGKSVLLPNSTSAGVRRDGGGDSLRDCTDVARTGATICPWRVPQDGEAGRGLFEQSGIWSARSRPRCLQHPRRQRRVSRMRIGSLGTSTKIPRGVIRSSFTSAMR